MLPKEDDTPKFDGLLLVPDTGHLAHANIAYRAHRCSSVTRWRERQSRLQQRPQLRLIAIGCHSTVIRACNALPHGDNHIRAAPHNDTSCLASWRFTLIRIPRPSKHHNADQNMGNFLSISTSIQRFFFCQLQTCPRSQRTHRISHSRRRTLLTIDNLKLRQRRLLVL